MPNTEAGSRSKPTDVGGRQIRLTASTQLSEVLRLASTRDENAWAELVRRLGWRIRAAARRSGASRADADDVEQLAWIALLRHIDQLKEPDRVAGWLSTTARRQSMRQGARNSRQVPMAAPLREQCASLSDVEAESLRGHFDGPLGAALDRLPESYRILLLMLHDDGMPSYGEVAEALQLPLGSIGPMRQRALRQLRQDRALNHKPSRV